MFYKDLPENNKVYIEDDYRPIKTRVKKLVHKDINVDRVMAMVRRDTRYGIDRRHRLMPDPERARMSAVKAGLTKAQTAEHVRCQHIAKELDELISFLQEELIATEYPDGLPKFDYEKYKNDSYIIQ